MNAQILIAQRCKKDLEDIAAFTAEKRAATQEFCMQNGGHFFGEWQESGFHPVFKVSSYEERVCRACGHHALRQPVYDELTVRVVEVEKNPAWDNEQGPIIDLEREED